MLPEEAYQTVFSKILHFLSYRDRTEKELSNAVTKYLRKVTCTESQKMELHAVVMHRLRDMGFVDDVGFTKNHVCFSLRSKYPPSPRSLKKSLLQKGVSQEIIESALAQHYDVQQALQNASKVAAKKLKTLGYLSEIKTRQKLTAYLFSKGFDSYVVYTVVDTNFKKD